MTKGNIALLNIGQRIEAKLKLAINEGNLDIKLGLKW